MNFCFSKRKKQHFEVDFKVNLRKRFARKTALDYLKYCFTDVLDNHEFLSWLSKTLGYRSRRLLTMINSLEKEWVPRRTLGINIRADIYNFWKGNSVVSVDGRNGRDKVRVTKLKYLQGPCSGIEDNLIQKDIVLKRKTKLYMQAQRMVQSDSIEAMLRNFNSGSLQEVNSSTFYRYKTFYVVAASEWEKQSCLCSICL